jgi:glycosyltransferase involved in cell wall biosynthesis
MGEEVIFVNPSERFDWGLIGSLRHMGFSVMVLSTELDTVSKKLISGHIDVGIDPDNPNTYVRVPVIKAYEDMGISLIESLCTTTKTIIIVPRGCSRRFPMSKFRCLKILYFSPTPFYIFKALGKISDGSLKRFDDILVGLGGLIYYYYKASQYNIVLFRDPKSYEFARSFLNMRKIRFLPPIYAKIFRSVKEKKGPEHETLDIKPENPYVLSVASIKTRKSDLYYIAYLNTLAKHIKEVDFVIIGTSAKDLSDLGIRITLEKNVHLVGPIFDDEVLAFLYKNATASIIPIILPGQSNRLIEALFYCTIPITNKLAMQYHLNVKNEFNAIIADLENTTQMTSIIKNLIKDDGYRETLKNNIRTSYRMYLAYVLKSLKMFMNSLSE